MTKYKIINVLALIFGLVCALILLTIFYVILLFNHKFIIVLETNLLSEFWIEFVIIHIFVLIIFIALISINKDKKRIKKNSRYSDQNHRIEKK